MTKENLIKQGAIWAFIAVELIFFTVMGDILSVTSKSFMDFENMLLLLKQH